MPEVENRLIPVLRDGINVVKMIFFRELKTHLAQAHPELDPAHIGKLSGAILNQVFGTPNTSEPFASFVVQNKPLIDQEVGRVATCFERLRIPLTDALRVQYLCDSQEGLQNEAALKSAQELGILISDRAVPLPKNFMNLVRKIGQAHGLIEPVDGVDDDEQPPGNPG